MTPEIAVLRALLRLARRRSPATIDELLVRIDADADEVRRAINALSRAGLVHTEKKVSPSSPPNTAGTPRLTMAGFAIAVAMTATAAQPKKKPTAPARVVPLVRRRRAA